MKEKMVMRGSGATGGITPLKGGGRSRSQKGRTPRIK
jgi:hypothetical protein